MQDLLTFQIMAVVALFATLSMPLDYVLGHKKDSEGLASGWESSNVPSIWVPNKIGKLDCGGRKDAEVCEVGKEDLGDRVGEFRK